MTSAKDFDHRNLGEVNYYLEQRIDALVRRIKDLEADNDVKSRIIEELAQRLDYNANLGAVGGE